MANYDVKALLEAEQQRWQALENELLELARRVEQEVKPEHFDTVFNAIVGVIAESKRAPVVNVTDPPKWYHGT